MKASSIGLMVVFILLALATVGHYGISWDEYFRWRGGDVKLAYYEALLSGDSDQVAQIRSQGDPYPGFFDLPLAIARRYWSGDEYVIGHAWCAAFGLLGIAGAMALGGRLAGPVGAVLAGLLLALFPRYWGHQFINPKDIPFAAMYVWGLWALVRMLRDDPLTWKRALVFGLLAGACMAVRIGGLLLLCYAGLFLGIQLVVNAVQLGPKTFQRQLRQYAVGGVVAGIVAFAVLIACWPSAHQNLFAKTAGAVAKVSHFGWSGDVLFGGQIYRANELPARYLPEMLARITPDWWWWLIISAVVLLTANVKHARGLWNTHRELLLVAFAVLFPLVYLLVRGSIVYDGARHVLFIIPPAAALLAAISQRCFAALKRRIGARGAWTWATPAALLALLTIYDMAQLHPYQYIYYNRMSGGVRGSAGAFETDYWGTAFREATEIFAAELPPAQRPWRITMEPPLELLFERYGKAVIPPPVLVEPFLGDHLVIVRSDEQPDFYIASSRNGYNDMREGKVLLAISRQGATLVEIKEFAPGPSATTDDN